MTLQPFEKIIIFMPVEKPKNGRVIGIKKEPDNSFSYMVEPRSSDFGPLQNGARIMRINSKDIGKEIIIQKHKS